MTVTAYDTIFSRVERWFDLPEFSLKAVAFVESSWRERAYRYEPVYWECYMKDNPIWKDRDPKEVSASYGLCQIMYDTGYRYYEDLKRGEELYDPELNVEIAGEFLRDLRGQCAKNSTVIAFGLDPLNVAFARYNGGPRRNPAPDGTLRNQAYVSKVLAAWKEIRGA